MPNNTFTFEEFLEISKRVQAAANKLSDYELDNFHHLNEKQRNRLRTAEGKLRNAARTLLEAATTALWDRVQPALADLATATDKMREAQDRITSFKRAMRIASHILTIAAAITSGNVIGIGTSTAGFLNAFDEFDQEDEDAQDDEDDAVG